MDEQKQPPVEPQRPDDHGDPQHTPLPQPKIRKYSLVFILITLLGAIAVTGLAVWLYNYGNSLAPNSNQQSNDPQPQTQDRTVVLWQPKGDGEWVATGGTAPTCPVPLFSQSPADTTLATSVLYPGQSRGGNYKPHGGLRFDTPGKQDITVKMPFDAIIYRGVQYIEQGETQYMFDVINPCGFMIRFDHLRTLSGAFKNAAATLPAASETTRTTNMKDVFRVKAGDTVATAVGFAKTQNIGFDFGVYDLSRSNEATKDPAYQQAHQEDKELSWHAVCWFDLLPSADASRVKSLPAGDAANGKKSDYCKPN